MKNRIQQIEQTGKTYKGSMLIGALVAIFGVLFATTSEEPGSASLGIFCLIAGIAVFIVAKICAWWNHG